MDTDVDKYRFYDGHALMINSSPFFAIDLCRHGFSQMARNTPYRNHHRAPFRLIPLDTPGLKLTPLAPLFVAAIPFINNPVINGFSHLKDKDFPLRTAIFIPLLTVLKVR